MDLLRFEHLKDSREDAEVTAPAELVEMIMKLRGEAAHAANG